MFNFFKDKNEEHKYEIDYKGEKITSSTQEEFEDFLDHCNTEQAWSQVVSIKCVK